MEEIAKADTDCASAAGVLAGLRARVEAHPGASLIATFEVIAGWVEGPRRV